MNVKLGFLQELVGACMHNKDDNNQNEGNLRSMGRRQQQQKSKKMSYIIKMNFLGCPASIYHVFVDEILVCYWPETANSML